MDASEFRRFGHQAVDWVADYLTGSESIPVTARIDPGLIRSGLGSAPPRQAEPMEDILRDFREFIVPGLVHPNHPDYFAPSPAGGSFPSILGELLSAGVGLRGQSQEAAPALTELEERVTAWLAQACGLPESFKGVIIGSASAGALAAVLAARERATDYRANQLGLTVLRKRLMIYASQEAHPSVERAVMTAGLGRESFRPVPVDRNSALDPRAFKEMVGADLSLGHQPCAVVATVGTPSTTARDPVEEVGRIAREHGLWLHVDAALAGAAAILPEKRNLFSGLELADSYVFNPHEWLFTTLDCSLFYTAEPGCLERTFRGGPEPLGNNAPRSAPTGGWGISPAGRLRALKLWFVIRSFGLEGLQEKLREHLAWARELAGWVEAAEDFDLLAPVPLQTVCFRFLPKGLTRPDQIDQLNERLMELLNTSGRIYLSLTRIGNRNALRFSIGTLRSTFEDVKRGWEFIRETARGLSGG